MVSCSNGRGKEFLKPARRVVAGVGDDFQGMAAHGLGMLRGVDREHLLEKISRRSVGPAVL
jgi:hypothetical protein